MAIYANAQSPIRPFLETALTTESLTATVPTTTQPTGDGVIAVPRYDGNSTLLLVPFGFAAAANYTCHIKVVGWRRASDGTNTDLWVPANLISIECTACTAVGVAGKVVSSTERFCDLITYIDGTKAHERPTVPADSPAVVYADAKGYDLLEIFANRGGGAGLSFSNVNALYGFI